MSDSESNIDLEHSALDYFGQQLMHEVRDKQIQLWEQTYRGTVNYSVYQKVYKKLTEHFDQDQLQVLSYLTPWIIDNTIDYILGMVEENKNIDIKVRINDDGIDLCKTADGLEGVLWSEDGWIERFSTEGQTNIEYFGIEE